MEAWKHPRNQNPLGGFVLMHRLNFDTASLIHTHWVRNAIEEVRREVRRRAAVFIQKIVRGRYWAEYALSQAF